MSTAEYSNPPRCLLSEKTLKWICESQISPWGILAHTVKPPYVNCPQLSKLLGREGDREGNWKRLRAPLAFRQGCPPGSEVTATAGRRPYGCHMGRARQMGKSSPLPLLSAEKQKSKTGRKNQAPFHSAAGAGWNRRAGPLSGCFWDNSLADAPGFSSLQGSLRRIYC